MRRAKGNEENERQPVVVVMDRNLKEEYGKVHEAVTRGEIKERIKVY